MRKIVSLAVLALVSGVAVAQVGGQVGRSGAQGGAGDQVNIQGNTTIKAASENSTAVAVGVGNEAKNATGAIKGGTNIQGNTKIDAKSKNSTAVAVGVGNKASNETGVIGGK